jgi:class 3 adenylate cyclase
VRKANKRALCRSERTGDISVVEFRSVVDAVSCAIEVQNAMVERNAGVPEDRRIVFWIGPRTPTDRPRGGSISQ